MQWAKKMEGDPPQHDQRVLKILSECERIAKNLKNAEAKAKWGEEKVVALERDLHEISWRLGRVEQQQNLRGAAALDGSAAGGKRAVR